MVPGLVLTQALGPEVGFRHYNAYMANLLAQTALT